MAEDKTSKIIGYVMQGLSLIPMAIAAISGLFSKDTTPAQNADAITNVTGVALQALSQDLTGKGTIEGLNEAQTVLPMIHDLTENLMKLAQSSGQPGADKADFVSNMVGAVLNGWQSLSKGPQLDVANQVVPAVKEAVTALKPILFPKTGIDAITNITSQ